MYIIPCSRRMRRLNIYLMNIYIYTYDIRYKHDIYYTLSCIYTYTYIHMILGIYIIYIYTHTHIHMILGTT
jgi:hypothetical protein